MGFLLGGCAGQPLTGLSGGQVGWVSYPSTWEKGLTLQGELVLPEKPAGKVPAMIVAHGSGGLDARNARWAAFLRQHGIASFQIAYFASRNVDANSARQPQPTHDLYDARQLLATHPRIDATRIGVIGFSRGAAMAVGAANAGANAAFGLEFAAYVALYPACGTGLLPSGAPVLVLIGSLDESSSARVCERVVENARAAGRDATVIVYEGAHHAWDGDFSGRWFHKAIGRAYTMQPNPVVAEQSRKDVLSFLRRALRLQP
ncbi:MAG: dienelactone hydrolase family protein [Myxococcota bacterium]